MKKIFTISAAVLLLLLISVYGFLQLRQYGSYKSRIHDDADLILRINVDGIMSANGFKFLRNPPHFLSLSKDSADLRKGFSVPANVFIYTVRSRSAQTYFCTLKVSDSADLKQYLKSTLKVGSFKTVGIGELAGQSTDGRLNIVYNANFIAFSYSIKKENTERILLDLIRAQHLMKETDARMISLKQEEANLAYNFRGFSGRGDLTGNTLSINGSFPIGKLGVPDQVYGRSNFKPDAAIKMWLNADFHQLFSKEKFCLKEHCLEGDSLLKYYDAYADLEVGPTIKQKDSVITYAYNDDFEKTEQVELKETLVPEINLCFSGKGESLANYFKHQMIIDPQNRLNKALFPLYQVYTTAESKSLQWSTNPNKVIEIPLKLASPYFIFAEISFDQLKKEGAFPLLKSYLAPLSFLKIKATKEGNQKANLEMELTFSNK